MMLLTVLDGFAFGRRRGRGGRRRGRLGGGRRCSLGLRAGRARTAHGHMTEDAVGDPEDARDLVEGVRLAPEQEQVVRALALVADLVRELAPPPRVLALPGAAAALSGLADPRDDLVLPVLLEVRIEQ